GLNEMIPKYQFGILANSESEIKNAAVSIMENYQIYRNNAFKFYLEYLDFEKIFTNVLRQIRILLQ
ncbi:MAG TPA: hypothetical protein DHV62_03765, partial [Elusimicrobia bacterium]|nr:hypothetical protein [Elusimicrobiota bacterium]